MMNFTNVETMLNQPVVLVGTHIYGEIYKSLVSPVLIISPYQYEDECGNIVDDPTPHVFEGHFRRFKNNESSKRGRHSSSHNKGRMREEREAREDKFFELPF